jgi:hypothetical protein
MDTCFRPMSTPSSIVTATGLLPLGSTPVRPSEPQRSRTRREWQGDLQEPPDLWDAQLGQFRVGIFPPPIGGWKPTKREPASRA